MNYTVISQYPVSHDKLPSTIVFEPLLGFLESIADWRCKLPVTLCAVQHLTTTILQGIRVQCATRLGSMQNNFNQ